MGIEVSTTKTKEIISKLTISRKGPGQPSCDTIFLATSCYFVTISISISISIYMHIIDSNPCGHQGFESEVRCDDLDSNLVWFSLLG